MADGSRISEVDGLTGAVRVDPNRNKDHRHDLLRQAGASRPSRDVGLEERRELLPRW